MSKRIYILNNIFLDKYGNSISVGGVETYIYNLCQIILDLGIKPVVFQQSNIPFSIDYSGILVNGLQERKIASFVSHAISKIPKNEVLIFANDEVVYGNYKGVIINLQHGIGWDFQKHKYRGQIFEKIYQILMSRDTVRRIKYSQTADYVVCVDYNYLNWFRTQVNFPKSRFVVIPNFSKVPTTIPIKTSENINIIFARRFTTYRGTRIFTEAIRQILNEYSNVKVTFAGSGPDEAWIKEQLKNYSRVNYITYSCDESLEVHADKHIAVIPSIGSEGTSLSLLEAMASGCAVVCTNVGGMTNIVLDHYNGIMVSPESEQLYTAIKELIDDQILRQELAVNAYNTVSKAFSHDKWEKAWKQLIDEIEKDRE